MSVGPDATEVEFGVKTEGKGNLIITAGTVEANLKVTMKWKRDRGPEQGVIRCGIWIDSRNPSPVC